MPFCPRERERCAVSHLRENTQCRIFKHSDFKPASLPLPCLHLCFYHACIPAFAVPASLPLPCLTCQDLSNSSPFCLRDKHQLAAGIQKPYRTLECHSPYGLSKRLRVSAQKVVCDLVSFLFLSLDDRSFECQDASHLESLCPASEFSDLNFTSERTAKPLSSCKQLYAERHDSISSDAREQVKIHSCRREPWGDVSMVLVLHLLSTNGGLWECWR